MPHPPGYPLFALLTRPFTWLPLHTIAWRANLASAVFAAAAAAMLAWSVMRASGQWWAGAAAAIVFAFSPVVWIYATSAEVFSLNNLLVAIQLCLFIAMDRSRRPVLAAAFVLGLGVSNHHTSVVFNIILLGAMLWRTRAQWTGLRSVAALIACGAAGLLPYIYLPIAAAGDAAVSWGDPSTLQGFVTHFLRREYGTLRLASSMAGVEPLTLFAQLSYYARDVVRQLSWPAVVLAVWGLGHAVRDRDTRFMAVSTFVAFSAHLVAFHSLANLPLDQPLIHGVVARFWQAPNMVVCFWAGLGLAHLAQLPRQLRVRNTLIPPIAVGFASVLAYTHADDARNAGPYMVHDYGASMLRAAPTGALILTRGDLITNSMRYLHAVERQRPDVRILDMELLTFRWMNARVARAMPDVVLPGSHYDIGDPKGYSIAQLIGANIAHRPIILCGGWKPGDISADSAYTRLPLGVCDAVTAGATGPRGVDIAPWTAASAAAMPTLRDGTRVAPDSASWEHFVWTDYWVAPHRRAFTILNLAIERGDDPLLLREAAMSFERLIADHPAVTPSHYKNLGIARARLATTDPESAAPAIAAFTRYLAVAPPGDPEAPAIMQVVRELQAARRAPSVQRHAQIGVTRSGNRGAYLT